MQCFYDTPQPPHAAPRMRGAAMAGEQAAGQFAVLRCFERSAPTTASQPAGQTGISHILLFAPALPGRKFPIGSGAMARIKRL